MKQYPLLLLFATTLVFGACNKRISKNEPLKNKPFKKAKKTKKELFEETLHKTRIITIMLPGVTGTKNLFDLIQESLDNDSTLKKLKQNRMFHPSVNYETKYGVAQQATNHIESLPNNLSKNDCIVIMGHSGQCH